jgi:hypothetical protein
MAGHHQLESRMREIRPSGSEGGVACIRHPYPYYRLSLRDRYSLHPKCWWQWLGEPRAALKKVQNEKSRN